MESSQLSGGHGAGAILLVDDCPVHSEVLGEVLGAALAAARLPQGIVALQSGDLAVSLLEEVRTTGPAPSLIVLDWLMPGVSGQDVLRWARRQPHLAGTPIVILSGSTHAPDHALARELGANDWIVKPVGLGAYTAMATDPVARIGATAPARRVPVAAPPAAGEHLRGLVHDIRSQVAIQFGACDLLEVGAGGGGIDGEKLTRFVGNIRAAAVRTRDILARMTAAPAAAAIAEGLDVNALLREELAVLAHDLVREGTNLHLAAAPGLPAVCGDRLEISRAVGNLVNNAREAIRATLPTGTGKILVETTPAPGDGGVVLSVADNGGGVPADWLERVWLPGESSKGGAGRGYGLAVVRRAAEEAGGHVELDSHPGQGSVFRVFLPPASAAAREQPTLMVPTGAITLA